jgi:hypothetical protein
VHCSRARGLRLRARWDAFNVAWLQCGESTRGTLWIRFQQSCASC